MPTDLRSLAAVVLLTAATPSLSAQQPVAPSPSPTAGSSANKSIDNPVDEQTLRAYLDEIHYVSWNRQAWARQFQRQQAQLPPWYPLAIWKETIDQIEAIDVVAVALPVYQRYWSENVGRHALKLFATPKGQAIAAKIFADQDKAQDAGEDAHDAYADALAAERAQEDAHVREIVKSVTPADQRELNVYLRSPEWIQADKDGVKITQEMSDALLARQKEIVHATAVKHRDELAAAKHAYDMEQKPAPAN